METRVAAIDLAEPGAEVDLFAATDGLEIGLFIYNAGADTINSYFLDVPAEEWHAMVRRNCSVLLLASHHYGAEMVGRKRGGILLVTSGAAWAGAAASPLTAARRRSTWSLPRACGPSCGATASTCCPSWSARPTRRRYAAASRSSA